MDTKEVRKTLSKIGLTGSMTDSQVSALFEMAYLINQGYVHHRQNNPDKPDTIFEDLKAICQTEEPTTEPTEDKKRDASVLETEQGGDPKKVHVDESVDQKETIEPILPTPTDGAPEPPAVGTISVTETPQV